MTGPSSVYAVTGGAMGGRLSGFGGWKGSALLLAVYVILDVGTGLLGGDWGAFLYVTFHFGVMPILSLGVILVTAAVTVRQEATVWKRVAVLASVMIPAAIIGVAASGEPGLSRFLPF